MLVVRDADGEEIEPPEPLDLAAVDIEVSEVIDPEQVDIDPVDYL